MVAALRHQLRHELSTATHQRWQHLQASERVGMGVGVDVALSLSPLTRCEVTTRVLESTQMG